MRRVLVDDDLATGAAGTATGRRGTGGTVIVEKILAAAADDRLDLDELVELGEEIVSSTRSLAAAWRPHVSPVTGVGAFELDEVRSNSVSASTANAPQPSTPRLRRKS